MVMDIVWFLLRSRSNLRLASGVLREGYFTTDNESVPMSGTFFTKSRVVIIHFAF